MELLEIEKELAGPEKMVAMERYDRQLVELGERLKRALDEGAPMEEYERLTELNAVVTIARKLLRLQVRD